MIPSITDSRHYGITDSFVVSNDNFIILTLDKTYTTYFSHNAITLNYTSVFLYWHNTSCLTAIGYVIYCLFTSYLAPSFYVLSLLRTLNEDPERIRYSDSCLSLHALKSDVSRNRRNRRRFSVSSFCDAGYSCLCQGNKYVYT